AGGRLREQGGVARQRGGPAAAGARAGPRRACDLGGDRAVPGASRPGGRGASRRAAGGGGGVKPPVVADVGNTRGKWGLCRDGGVAAMASLPPDDPAAWDRQAADWRLPGACAWAVAGVHPQRRDRLAAWVAGRGQPVAVLDDWRRLPLEVRLEHPE